MRQVGAQDFQRHPTLQRGVVRPQDDPHAAAPQLALDEIRPQRAQVARAPGGPRMARQLTGPSPPAPEPASVEGPPSSSRSPNAAGGGVARSSRRSRASAGSSSPGPASTGRATARQSPSISLSVSRSSSSWHRSHAETCARARSPPGPPAGSSRGSRAAPRSRGSLSCGGLVAGSDSRLVASPRNHSVLTRNSQLDDQLRGTNCGTSSARMRTSSSSRLSTRDFAV